MSHRPKSPRQLTNALDKHCSNPTERDSALRVAKKEYGKLYNEYLRVKKETATLRKRLSSKRFNTEASTSRATRLREALTHLRASVKSVIDEDQEWGDGIDVDVLTKALAETNVK